MTALVTARGRRSANCTVAVFADQERTVAGDRYADRAAPHPAVVEDKALI